MESSVEYKGYTIEIVHDDIATFHHCPDINRIIPVELPIDYNSNTSITDLTVDTRFSRLGIGRICEVLTEAGAAILPLYFYNHSGYSISTVPFNCKYDSSCVGFVHLPLDKVNEYGGLTKSVGFLKSEVAQYNEYLQGNTFGYNILKHQEGKETIELESCFGFIGEHKDSGIIESAKGVIDEQVQQVDSFDYSI